MSGQSLDRILAAIEALSEQEREALWRTLTASRKAGRPMPPMPPKPTTPLPEARTKPSIKWE